MSIELSKKNEVIIDEKETRKVLIVDDDEGIRAMLPRILRVISANGSGYKFEVAANVDSVDNARAELDNGLNPDVVFSDMMMPLKTGKDLFEELEGDERTRHLIKKMIFMSGGIDPRHPQADALEQFVRDRKEEGRFLQKPDGISNIEKVREMLYIVLKG